MMQPPLNFLIHTQQPAYNVTHHAYASTLGDMRLSVQQDTLVGLQFDPEARHQFKPLSQTWIPRIEALLRRDWSQGPKITAYGTLFQLQVWTLLSALEAGHTTTYGQLAKTIGKAGAGQAVGQAVKANPLNWIIPCHRVLPAQGGIGGFRWGPQKKIYLLEKDGFQQ